MAEEEIRYKKIGEVADELKINESNIRYWEKAFPTIITPLKRSGGRRCYTDEDIAVLKAIKTQIYDYNRTLADLQAAVADGFLADKRKTPRPTSSDGEPTLFTVNGDVPPALKADDVTAVIKDLQSIKSALDSLL